MYFLVLPITGFFSHIFAISISTTDFSNLEYSSLFCSEQGSKKTHGPRTQMNSLPLFHNPLCKVSVAQRGSVIRVSAKKWVITSAKLREQPMNL